MVETMSKRTKTSKASGPATELQRWMKETGISTYALARASGVDRVMISRLARRIRTPSLRAAQKIAAATGGAVPLDSWDPL